MTATAQPTTLPDGRSLLWEHTGWDDPRAQELRAAMDAEIGPRYAALRGSAPRPAQPTTEDVAVVVLALVGAPATVAATGTLRRLADRWEVKRLFIDADHRRFGLARRVLARLEEAARERGASELFLQTGNRQPEAIALYEREGWARIDVFAPYDPADGISVCFRKALTPRP
ncbi:GNAT family N-acetyltransferase [Brachybacterium saurashtrense]|uniref:GNAT family N-acetyltransferase n=1 Tax=Brachybacterium saurashtrense TaxID=556288 RepID=A0A345YKB2_9MICO|nr:GNAT family N-acetyltransferase [Brachybacterium saurashtrense]AXK44364.1 GNAT family N-acetyltransferase [Brachybacterium saurashtrense]RRR21306.1 GNAT family N-acetyltransferase [Brachybacterium saurashtrense]RRR22975.1 GNAT family N-acetyltransferase [Brachybacterium saurashtrense]